MDFNKKINELYSIYANKPETKECYQAVSKCYFTIIREIGDELRKELLIQQCERLRWGMPITADE